MSINRPLLRFTLHGTRRTRFRYGIGDWLNAALFNPGLVKRDPKRLHRSPSVPYFGYMNTKLEIAELDFLKPYRMVSVRTAAATLGIDQKTLRRWLRRKKLGVRIGPTRRTIRIPLSQITAIVSGIEGAKGNPGGARRG